MRFPVGSAYALLGAGTRIRRDWLAGLRVSRPRGLGARRFAEGVGDGAGVVGHDAVGAEALEFAG